MATSQNGRAGSTPMSTAATNGKNAVEAEAEAVDLRSGTRRSAAAVTPDVEPAPMEPVSTSLLGALKRTLKEFKKDNLSDWAAALTSNGIYRVGEGRPVWKTLPIRIAVTIILVVLLVISAAIVVFSGPIADKTGKALGISPTLITVFEYAKWPVLIIIVSAMLAILYYAAPNVKQPGVKWVSPGGLVAVIVWVVASALFAFYVANFGSYNKTYGALASVIIFLIWLYITNLAILLGAEFNAEIQRGHADSRTFLRREPMEVSQVDPGTIADALPRAEQADQDMTQ